MSDATGTTSDTPVGITGLNASGVPTNPVNADSNGNLNVVTYSSGPVTPGTVAAVATLIAAQFNTALPTLTNTQQAALQLDSSGRLIIRPLTSADIVTAAQGAAATTAGAWPAKVTDGTNTAAVKAASTAAAASDPSLVVALSSNSPFVVGAQDKSTFTYGTTIQQTIGGVFQDSSPTLSAGQEGAVRLNQNRALHTTLRDPSTDAGITSDNNGTANDQRLHMATPDTTTASTALGALNATVSISMSGLASAGFQILAGTLVGTLVAECSIDGGTTWASASFYDPSNSTVTSSIVFGSSNTTKVLSTLPIGGSSHVRVRVSAYTSGTANAILRASEVTGAAGAITAAAFGTVTNTNPSITGNSATQILAANVNRKYAYISNTSGSQITIQFGSSTGLSTTTGLVIPAKSFYELKGDNLYTGVIYGYCAGTVTISVTEGTP